MAKLRGRAKQFAAFDEHTPKDFDPEADSPDDSHDSRSSDESIDENAGTEHYVSVGKSRLRQKESVALGPQYRGARVSRVALDDESNGNQKDDVNSSQSKSEEQRSDSEYEVFDDPDGADLSEDEKNAEDAEIDSDDALGESDEERFEDFVFRGSSRPRSSNRGYVSRPTAADFIDSDECESDVSDNSRNCMEVDLDGTFGFPGMHEDSGDDDKTDQYDTGGKPKNTSDGNGENEDEDGQSDSSCDMSEGRSAGPGELFTKGLLSTVSNLSASVQREAAQGLAIRQQRKSFDAILNVRVRLQKSLVAINTFGAVNTDNADDKRPYQAAEEAAIKLWNSLDRLRAIIQPDAYAALTQKRKREADSSTSNQDLWENMKAVEKRVVSLRKSNLERWSEKANRGFVTSAKSGGKQEFRQTLTSALEGQLMNPERLIQKTQVPRSCAPVQAGKSQADPNIYDDADFYQMLLKELLDQRTSESAGPGNGVTTVVWTARKDAKQKKLVDTKASKGRRMRFTVYEKIQNFMAPEDRRSWEQPAIDRLFGSLFGKEVKLDEGEETDETENEYETAPVEEQSLKLFRT